MADTEDKLIVTNAGALKAKYGAQGFAAIKTALDALAAADQARGLTTRLIALDDKVEMQKLSAPAVTKAADPRQNKRAIDAVFRAIGPDYIVLLGSTDVIPHQDLRNPTHGPDDEDVFAFGDVPYACEAPYSQDPGDFVGPTRVVGRIPDMTKGGDPAYLVGLLGTAASHTAAQPAAFKDYFAVTAQVWEKSTRLSAANTYGEPAQVASVPPKSSKWSTDLLQRRTHFFNCHGAQGDPRFFGQPTGKDEYPVALDASRVQGNLREGIVVAAECCYGGELYDLSPTRKQAGLCNTYLANKAYGFFASTTIAYGPAEGNGQADLICQFFLQKVLGGASLGRAALEARQEFVRSASPPDPFDLKTIAQFNLYGDPSLAPVQAPPGFVVAASASHTLAERVERGSPASAVQGRAGVVGGGAGSETGRGRAGTERAGQPQRCRAGCGNRADDGYLLQAPLPWRAQICRRIHGQIRHAEGVCKQGDIADGISCIVRQAAGRKAQGGGGWPCRQVQAWGRSAGAQDRSHRRLRRQGSRRQARLDTGDPQPVAPQE